MSAAPTVVGMDLEAVGAWVAGLGIGARPPLTARRVGAGQSNLTYLIEDAAGRRWILRRPPLGRLLASAHDVAREARVLSALERTDVPAPAVHGVCTDPAVTDAPLVLMEHVDGVVVDTMAVAQALPLERRAAISASLVATLGRIHAVDLRATGLDTLASHKPYAARQLKRWRRQWDESRTRDLPLVEELADRLAAAVPDQCELSLVHGDFHLLNVIAAPRDGTVVAVLDWELCTLGDPLADLGGLLAYWPEAGDGGGASFPAPALPGFPDRARMAATYAEASGRDVADVAFWHVLGLWKIAIIVEGILRRIDDDPRNSAVAGAPSPRLADDLLARAEREAARAGL